MFNLCPACYTALKPPSEKKSKNNVYHNQRDYLSLKKTIGKMDDRATYYLEAVSRQIFLEKVKKLASRETWKKPFLYRMAVRWVAKRKDVSTAVGSLRSTEQGVI